MAFSRWQWDDGIECHEMNCKWDLSRSVLAWATLAAHAINATTTEALKRLLFVLFCFLDTAFCYVVQAGPKLFILMTLLSGATRIAGVLSSYLLWGIFLKKMLQVTHPKMLASQAQQYQQLSAFLPFLILSVLCQAFFPVAHERPITAFWCYMYTSHSQSKTQTRS